MKAPDLLVARCHLAILDHPVDPNVYRGAASTFAFQWLARVGAIRLAILAVNKAQMVSPAFSHASLSRFLS